MRRHRAALLCTGAALLVLALSLYLPSLALPPKVSGEPASSQEVPVEVGVYMAYLQRQEDTYNRYAAAGVRAVSCSDSQTREMYYVLADLLELLTGSSPLGEELLRLGADYWTLADATTFSASVWEMAEDSGLNDCYCLETHSALEEYYMYTALLLDRESLEPVWFHTELHGAQEEQARELPVSQQDTESLAVAWGRLIGGADSIEILEDCVRYETAGDMRFFHLEFARWQSGFALSAARMDTAPESVEVKIYLQDGEGALNTAVGENVHLEGAMSENETESIGVDAGAGAAGRAVSAGRSGGGHGAGRDAGGGADALFARPVSGRRHAGDGRA